MIKSLNSKLLAKATIITIILSFIYTIISGYNYIPLRTIILYQIILNYNFYILIYLLLFLDSEKKDPKKLNLALIICITITAIISIASNIIHMPLSISINYINLIRNIIYSVLIVIMLYGITKKSKMPYELFTIILIAIIFTRIIPIIISFFYNIVDLSGLFDILGLINANVCSCCFVLFLYSCSKNKKRRIS